jgi:hypothetical protein
VAAVVEVHEPLALEAPERRHDLGGPVLGAVDDDDQGAQRSALPGGRAPGPLTLEGRGRDPQGGGTLITPP